MAKNKSYCFIILLITIYTISSSEQQLPGHITITVNPHMINTTYNNPTQTSSNNIATDVSTTHHQQTNTTLKVKLPHISFDRYQETARAHGATIHAWLLSHKTFILVTTVVGFYTFLCFYVHRIQTYLRSPTLWSSWKKSYTIHDLVLLNEHELADALVAQIQATYLTSCIVDGSLAPFIAFVHACEAERITLCRYKSVIAWLDSLYLSRIIFVKKGLYIQLQERIDRLDYIKKIFDHWIGNHQIQLLYAQERPTLLQKVRAVIDGLKKISEQATKRVMKILLLQ